MSVIITLFLISFGLFAQTKTVSDASGTGVFDESGAVTTRPVQSGNSDPATCTSGKDMFINTSSTPVLKLCTATNTWTAVGGGASIFQTTYAGRTACSSSTFTNYYTDSRYLYGICNGSSTYTDYLPTGKAFNTFPSWTLINVPTNSTTNGGLIISSTANSKLIGNSETTGASTFTRTAVLIPVVSPANGGNPAFFLGVSDGTKYEVMSVFSSGANGGYNAAFQFWSNSTTFGSTDATIAFTPVPGQPIYLRVVVDATNMTWFVGDGVNFIQLQSGQVALATHTMGTITNAIIGVNPSSSSGANLATAWLLSWQ